MDTTQEISSQTDIKHMSQVLVHHNFFTATDKICKFSPIMTIFAGVNVGEAQLVVISKEYRTGRQQNTCDQT